MKRTLDNYFGNTNTKKKRSLVKTKSTENNNKPSNVIKKNQSISDVVIEISSDSEEDFVIESSKKCNIKATKSNKSENTPKKNVVKKETTKNNLPNFQKRKLTKNAENSELKNDEIKNKNVLKESKLNKKKPNQKISATNTTDALANKPIQISPINVEPDQNNIEKSENSENTVPYFLQNFLSIIETVLNNPNDVVLFEGEDMQWINLFLNLSQKCQMLYVRLYNRKRTWLPATKISYPKIAEDLTDIFKQLTELEFILCNDLTNKNNDLPLSLILSLLSAPHLKSLAKSFQLSKSSNKPTLQSEIMLMCKKQKGILSGGNMKNLVIKRALKLLGPCYKISLIPKKVFNRLLLVFDITKGTESDTDYSMLGYNQSTFGRHQQLSTMVMTGMGMVTYPTYTVDCKTQIFGNREELLEYEVAHHYLSDMMGACEVSDWKQVIEISGQAELRCQELNKDIKKSSLNLPSFLRSYSSPAVYTKIKSLKVEVLQRLKDYNLASTLLQELLEQEDFCVSKKGHWAERLTLILDQHLRQPDLSLKFAKTYMNNKNVRVGHILALKERLSKITKTAIDPPYKTPPAVEITGRLLPKRMQSGAARFMRQVDESMLLCSVEELALDHYKNTSYNEGIHGEGGTFASYLCLLMWDIIFMSGVSDVFRSQYQSHPLDLYSDDFYLNRKEKIDQRLNDIKEWESDNFNVVDKITKTWEDNFEISCTGMNWGLFKSVGDAVDLARCMGGPILSQILTRMVKDFRHTRSGLPDLIVWNNTEYKLVEVKGPGDRLSNNQKMWMDYLMNIGANVEVCRVVAGGSRQI